MFFEAQTAKHESGAVKQKNTLRNPKVAVIYALPSLANSTAEY
jgi:hypothetical protein